jgi:hypothetical protein
MVTKVEHKICKVYLSFLKLSNTQLHNSKWRKLSHIDLYENSPAIQINQFQLWMPQ